MGIYIRPRDIYVNVWVDAGFSGNWFPEQPKDNSDTARYCSGFVVSYLGCPVMCKLQFHTEIYLSSTEVDYIALNQ